MGVIKQGILGGFSGRVAGVVGSSWKGIAVIKSRPLSVANPRTAAQTGQRTKFAAVVALASLYLSAIVKPLWDRFAQAESGYNAFVKANIAAFSTAGVLDYGSLKISSGKMAITAIDSIVVANLDETLTVNWTDDSGTGLKLATDEAYILVLNDNDNGQGALSGTVVRSAATATVDLSTFVFSGDSMKVYLAFKRADGTVVSDTTFVASLVA